MLGNPPVKKCTTPPVAPVVLLVGLGEVGLQDLASLEGERLGEPEGQRQGVPRRQVLALDVPVQVG